MAHVNENYLKLPGNYLFATIAKKVEAYSKAHPEANIIRLGIGDVTRPLAPAIIDAMHKAVDEMGKAETFRGYGPEQGYDFLRQAIIDGDYKKRGIDLDLDEVFVGDGAKTDVACIQEIFGDDLKFAVADPVYPVYLDSNVMFGHTGEWNAEKGIYDGVVYLPCTPENGFKAEPPKEKVDIVYLCNPSNPTGTAMSKEELTNWVKAAKENNFIIIYDSAYETYITEPDVPHRTPLLLQVRRLHGYALLLCRRPPCLRRLQERRHGCRTQSLVEPPSVHLLQRHAVHRPARS